MLYKETANVKLYFSLKFKVGADEGLGAFEVRSY